MKKLIYIADDDDNIRSLVKTFLLNSDYDVYDFENGELLLKAFDEKECDMVILDVMMPKMDGFEVCKKIREKSTVPIIMLTARGEEIDYITGISIGSDDYFTKPFSPMSLVMRIKAIFRRIDIERNNIDESDDNKERILEFGNVKLDKANKSVECENNMLNLTPNEFSLLSYLLEKNDRAVSRDELLNEIWGYSSEIETRAVDDTVKRLRKKIKDTGIEIQTVWGYGFRVNDKQGED